MSGRESTGQARLPEWPAGGGEMGARIRARDWTATPLGPMGAWPQSLRTVVDVVLGCDFPMVALWGTWLAQVYNDGYRALMGVKHPAGLGQPTRDCWPEVWHINEPIYARVLAGETVTREDALYPITRRGYLEDAWFTLCYSPLRDEAGAIAGVLVTVFETTERMLAARQRDDVEARLRASEAQYRSLSERHAFLLALSDRLRELDVPASIMATTAELLGRRLGATRASYTELHEGEQAATDHDWTDSAASPTPGPHPAADWMPEIGPVSRRGEPWRVEDIASDPRPGVRDLAPAYAALGIRAALAAPVLRGGRWVALVCLHSAAPRAWTDDETRLVQETAARAWDAVERARALAALRASEARLRRAIEIATVGVIFFKITGEISYANEGFLRMSGYTREDWEACRVRWDEMTPPEYMPASLATVEEFKRYGRTTPYEKEYIRKDGSRWWALFAATSLGEGPHGEGVEFVVDITERKRAEAALGESEAHFRAVADLVPDLLWRNDLRGVTTWYNRRWHEYTGQTLEEADGYGWLDAIHPDDRERSLANFQGAVNAGRPLRQEHRIRRADGAYRWFLVRAEPLREADGRIAAWYGAATDVHEQRLAQEELEWRVAERTAELAAAVEGLRASEGRQRLLLEQMPAALWTTDADLRITALAGSLAPALPPALSLGRGRPLAEIAAYDATVAPLLAAHRRALAGEQADVDLAWGELRFAGHIEPMFDAGGDVAGTIGVAHDVTARALLRQQEEFIANASHELRSPLTALRACLGVLELGAGSALGPEERELLAAARANAERLRLHIDDLLAARDLLAASAAQIDPPLTRTPLDLRALVTGAVAALRPLLDEKGQPLAVDLPEPLPAAGDVRRLEQIAVNLLANANRHTPPGTRISVTGRAADGMARITVRDSGPGIPADRLEAIFERFRGAGHPTDGSGLGLAIARDIARLHGGRLWAEAAPGGGAVFHLALPLAPGSGAGAAT